MGIITGRQEVIHPTMGQPNDMKYIKLHPSGWFIQMYRNKLSISKLLPHKTPLAKVIATRDAMVAEQKDYFYLDKSSVVMARNKDLPVGVTTVFAYNRKRTNQVVTVSVHVKDDEGKGRTKGFYVGAIGNFTPDKLEHAVLTGCAYREDFEYCVKNDLPFFYLAWDYYTGWLEKHVFDLTCEERVADYV